MATDLSKNIIMEWYPHSQKDSINTVSKKAQCDNGLWTFIYYGVSRVYLKLFSRI